MAVIFGPPKRKPNFTPRMRKPRLDNMIRHWPPVAYPPWGSNDTEPVKHREVKPGPLDTFWDLAAKVDRHSNPWDIIIYNFETEDPLEVNWYLHHAVGCWKSSDGLNFNFESADPGKLYLPTDERWKPPSRFSKGSGANRFVNGLINTAVGLLERAAVDFPTVKYIDTTVSAADLRKVGELLESHEITLSIEPGNLGATRDLGQYVSSARTMKLVRPPHANDTEMMGVLCNEATHAITHYRSKKVKKVVNYGRHELTSSIVGAIAVAKQDANLALKLYRADPPGAGSIYLVGLVVQREFAGVKEIDVQRDLVGKTFPDPTFPEGAKIDALGRHMAWHNVAYGEDNWKEQQSFYWDEQKGDMKP
jgi:hypothetical protein